MKNRRFYAVVLLAVLALLQVRVAFAACDMRPAATTAGASCCSETHEGTQATANVAAPCTAVHCVEAHAAQADDRFVTSQVAWEPTLPPAPAFHIRAANPSPGVSLTPAQLPHTRLIYVLQRLLI